MLFVVSSYVKHFATKIIAIKHIIHICDGWGKKVNKAKKTAIHIENKISIKIIMLR